MDKIIEKLKKCEELIIYGVPEISDTLNIFLKSFEIDCKCIVESTDSIKSDESISKLHLEVGNNSTLIVATQMQWQEEISEKLHNFKGKEIIYLTGDMYNFLKYEYVKKNFYYPLPMLKELSSENSCLENKDKVKIYMVKSAKDKPLENSTYLPEWIIPIQAGKACTSNKIAEVTDDTGENISAKNPVYCELTGTYWVWKNAESKYLGLCHYRRYFDLDAKDMECLVSSDTDVVLPVPTPCMGSVKEHYLRIHIPDHWETMMQVLEERYPDYYKTAENVFNKEFYYACNMLIAKKEVFDEYCSWLFNILFELEKRCRVVVEGYNSRYIGFLAERLTSLYFMHNRDKLKIVYAEKTFIK